MAFSYGFYNSLNGDRRYKAEDFGNLVGSLITDGVFENVGQKLFATVGNGMEIHIGSGKAWFNNTWSENDSTMVLEVPQSDITRPRYDTVVLDVNNDISVRENKIMIVSGEPQVNPVKPILVNTEKHHQYALAHILVPAAATEITASNIEIVVGQDPCPFCTSILQKTDITDLYNKWEADFQTWFNNLKDQLTSNVVTNLQSQIDTLRDEVEGSVKYSDKASEEDVENSVENKWVDAKALSTITKNGIYVDGKLMRLGKYYIGNESYIVPNTITNEPLFYDNIPILELTSTSAIGVVSSTTSGVFPYSFRVITYGKNGLTRNTFTPSTSASYSNFSVPSVYFYGDCYIVSFSLNSNSNYSYYAAYNIVSNRCVTVQSVHYSYPIVSYDMILGGSPNVVWLCPSTETYTQRHFYIRTKTYTNGGYLANLSEYEKQFQCYSNNIYNYGALGVYGDRVWFWASTPPTNVVYIGHADMNLSASASNPNLYWKTVSLCNAVANTLIDGNKLLIYFTDTSNHIYAKPMIINMQTAELIQDLNGSPTVNYTMGQYIGTYKGDDYYLRNNSNTTEPGSCLLLKVNPDTYTFAQFKLLAPYTSGFLWPQTPPYKNRINMDETWSDDYFYAYTFRIDMKHKLILDIDPYISEGFLASRYYGYASNLALFSQSINFPNYITYPSSNGNGQNPLIKRPGVSTTTVALKNYSYATANSDLICVSNKIVYAPTLVEAE